MSSIARAIARNLNQTAVHWVKTGDDGFGGYTYAVGVEVSVRWEGKTQLFRAADGEEKVSRAIIYTTASIAPNDWLFLGSLTDLSSAALLSPVTEPDAQKVERVEQSWNLNASTSLRKVFV